MSQAVSAEILESIWLALHEEIPRCRIRNERQRVGRIVAEVWVPRYQIEDLAYDWDDRLHRVDLIGLADAMGLRRRIVYNIKGFSALRGLVGYEQMHMADVASLMIRLEGMGFRVDPTEIVHAVAPSLKGLKRVTDAELDVLKFAKGHGKPSACKLFRDQRSNGELADVAKLKTPTGYAVLAALDSAGRPLSLELKPPRGRKRDLTYRDVA